MSRLIMGLFTMPAFLYAGAIIARYPLSFWFMINAALYPALLLISIALHEAGHAAVGRLLGFEVPRVEVGIGKRIARWRWRGTTILVNSLPTIGFTFLGMRDTRCARARLWLTIAAGPLTTGLLCASAMARLPTLPLAQVAFPVQAFAGRFAAVELFASVNLLMLVLNMIPIPLRVFGPHSSDGRQLVTLPFIDQARLDELTVVAAAFEAEERRAAGDLTGAQRVVEVAFARAPSSFLVLNMLATLHLEREELQEARASFLALLERQPSHPTQHWVVRNNLAWTNFRIRSSELRAEADSHSAAVVAHFSKASWALGTRGAVLLWLGRLDEAVPLLELAYASNSEPANRALNACCLAMATAAQQRDVVAARWLAKARDNDSTCKLLAEAEAATRH